MSAVSLWKLETYFFSRYRTLPNFLLVQTSVFFFFFLFSSKISSTQTRFHASWRKRKLNRNSPRFDSLLSSTTMDLVPLPIPFTKGIWNLYNWTGERVGPGAHLRLLNGIVRRIDVFSRYPTEDRGKMTEAFFTLRVGWAGRNPFPISSVSYPWTKRYAVSKRPTIRFDIKIIYES